MKKTRLFALLCTLFLLTGCTAPEEPTAPPNRETTPEASTEVGFHHAMVKPSAQDRCAATSLGQLVETENGYYMVLGRHILYYADKSDLTDWVVVCNQPDCKHNQSPLVSRQEKEPECHAYVYAGIWSVDGKIYTVTLNEEVSTDVILSSPGDGSGWTTVFYDEDSPFTDTEGGISWNLECYQDGLCMNVVQMEPNGFWDSYLYFVDKNGAHKYPYAEDFPDVIWPSGSNASNQMRGDMVKGLIMEYPGQDADIEALATLYRVSPEAIEKLEFPEGCDCYGAYLSGDTMIHYHPNDGFYKLDYYGGTEEKIADAAYTDGFGFCLDGEFLIETTVNYQSTAKECKFRYFDGTEWTEVPLPEEFTPETNLRIVALASDTLFLEDFATGGALYMVKLGDNQMVKCMDLIDTAAY